jgi:hypothetical protein
VVVTDSSASYQKEADGKQKRTEALTVP